MAMPMADKLATFMKRQPGTGWVDSYQPAIRATPKEAPRISRPTRLTSSLLGRDLHLLSIPEANAAILALYSGLVVDIHEQKLLSCTADVHPLYGHPEADGLQLSPILGTISVAERMGALTKHPAFIHPQLRQWVPFPYVGDLLLYLRDAAGLYCVNWTIKLTSEDFLRPSPHRSGKPRRNVPQISAEQRHLIEEVYYADAGIRTVRVAGNSIDATLIANLRELYLWHNRRAEQPPELIEHIIGALQKQVGGTLTAYDAIASVSSAVNVDWYTVKLILAQAVWSRTIRIDLTKPFLIDRPLAAERSDAFNRYWEWLRR